MKKMLGLALAFGLATSAMAAYTAPTPTRVGPVSQYGKLLAGKNAQKVGRIYGSCDGVKTGKEVRVRGMSLFWSMSPSGAPYYDETYVNALVKDMKIELIRAAMGYDGSEWENDGYLQDETTQKDAIKRVVDAAIKNDIYVIIDWNSHNVHKDATQADKARAFFKEMATTYKGVDNVIFEIYNEPACNGASSTSGGSCDPKDRVSWSSIKSYEESVIAEIRSTGNTNLIVAGTPYFDAYPNDVISDPIADDNLAYTFHYYASSHSTGDQGQNAVSAMQAGYSVFVTEWGTCEYTGNGSVKDSENTTWRDWLNNNDLSAANWSVSDKGESCSAFSKSNQGNGQVSGVNNLYYTTSGKMVKNQLALDVPDSYSKCSTGGSTTSSASSSTSGTGDTEIIDDFNDGNTGIEKLGEDAFWYLYKYGTATLSNKQDTKTEVWDMISGTTSNYYAAMKTINVSSGSGVGMEAQLPLGSLAKCSAISYKYKGAAHKFRASMDGITANEGYEHTSAEFAKTTDWTPVTISTKNLVQASHTPSADKKAFDWAKVFKISFIIESATSNGELDIDDVTCVGELSGVVEDDPSSSASKPSSSAGTSSPSSANSSASVNPGSSASTPVVSEANIDDFEDGDNVAKTGEEDYWYAFTDVNDGGKSTISNENKGTAAKPDYSVVIAEAAAEGSEYGAGLTDITLNQGTNKNDPYVALGLDIAGGLAGCKTVTYKYKGAAHNFKAVMSGDEKGGLTEYNRHSSAQTGSTSWTEASIDVADLKQAKDWGKTIALNMAKVGAFQWEVKGTPSANYLYIDDVSCVGATGSNSSSSGSGITSSGSSSVTLTGNVDDFEDGDNVAGTGAKDYWYVYTDADDGGNSTFSNESDDNGYVVVFPEAAANGSEYGAGMTGIVLDQGSNENAPYVALGLDIAGALRGCRTIAYDYKGAAHNLKAILKGDDKVDSDGKSMITGWDRHFAKVPASEEWTVANIPSTGLKQEGWGKKVTLNMANVVALQWEVKGTAEPDYLYVDNVTCVGLSATGSSSSTTNHRYSSSSGSNNSYDAISVSMAQSGLKVGLRGNTLNITVAKAGLVKVQVFDMMGHVVENRVDNMAAGTYAHEFGAMAKGSYVVRVQQGSYSKSVRLQVR